MRHIILFLLMLMAAQAQACELVSARNKPLSEPGITGLQEEGSMRLNLSFPQVANWLGRASMEAMRVSNGQLEGPADGNFTTRGQEEFISFIGQNEKLSKYIESSDKIVALIQHVPVLIFAGVSGKRYVWNYDLPLILISQRPEKPPLYVTAHVRITRSDDPAHDKGIAIDQWRFAEGRSY
jgi:hypothetical protein